MLQITGGRIHGGLCKDSEPARKTEKTSSFFFFNAFSSIAQVSLLVILICLFLYMNCQEMAKSPGNNGEMKIALLSRRKA